MAEIRLELNLARASGVLAGIVATLAQAGLELRSQRLARAPEGRGGTLDIVLDGDPPEPGELVTMMESARGVDRLMRIEIDGEAVLAEGRVLEDIMDADSLAALSAGQAPDALEPDTPVPTTDVASETQPGAIPAEPQFADDETRDTFRNDAELLEATARPESTSPESTNHESTAAESTAAESTDAESTIEDATEASETTDSPAPPEPPKGTPAVVAESNETTPAGADPVRDDESAEPADPNRVEAALRRRRRRRR